MVMMVVSLAGWLGLGGLLHRGIRRRRQSLWGRAQGCGWGGGLSRLDIRRGGCRGNSGDAHIDLLFRLKARIRYAPTLNQYLTEGNGLYFFFESKCR
jgi:hypothetical protein